MDIEFWKLIFAVTIPTVGWIVGYLLKQKGDIANAKRSKRIDFLLGTYLKLEKCINRDLTIVGKDLEEIMAEVQVMGTEEQIELVRSLARSIAEDGTGNLEPMLISLRNDLRKELQLKETNLKIEFLRMWD